MTKTSDALEIIQHHLSPEPDPARDAEIDEYRVQLRIAQMIYDLREAAGLTQAQLAEKVGTRQSVISRLEDADYSGHSLRMLFRIARALGKRLEIRISDALETEQETRDPQRLESAA